MASVTCAACGEMLNPAEHPTICPVCGSGDRLIEASDTAAATVREAVGLKKRRHGEKKPHEEIKAGDDLHRETGQWNKLERVIDRDNDWYSEVVTDPEGNIIRHCSEPLSHHRGHGSTKGSKQGRSP